LCRVAADGVNFRSSPSILLSRETETLTNYSTLADADDEYGYKNRSLFSTPSISSFKGVQYATGFVEASC
jgi:hypothetical protein